MHILLFAGAAFALAGTAMAEPVTRTRTYDGPKIEATRTTSVDRDAGTFSREAQAVRKSDGATASRAVSAQRTEDGMTASGSATNFQGQTRAWDYARTRTADGYTASGSGTGFDGRTYGYAAEGRRTADGRTRSQTLTDGSGAVIASRQARVGRADGQVTRDVSSTRPQRMRPQPPRRRR